MKLPAWRFPTHSNLYLFSNRTMPQFASPIISTLLVLLGALCFWDTNHAAGQVQTSTTTILLPANAFFNRVAQVNETTNKLYVPMVGGLSGLYVVDGASNAVSHVSGAADAEHVAVNEVTNNIYTSVNGNIIQVIDGSNNSVSSFSLASQYSIAFGNDPLVLTVDPTTNRLYIQVYVNLSTTAVVVVDCKTNSVIRTIPDFSPFAYDFTHQKIYARGLGAGLNIYDIATQSMTFVAGSPSDSETKSGVVDVSRNKIYLLNGLNSVTGGGTVSVFDGATATLETTRSVGMNPQLIALNPDTHVVWVWNSGSSSSPSAITALDENNLFPNTFSAGFHANFDAAQMLVDSSLNKVYVAGVDAQDMLVINGATLQVAAVGGYSSNNQFGVINQTTHRFYSFGSIDSGGHLPVDLIDGTGGTTAYASIFPTQLQFYSSAGTPNLPQTVYVANVGSQPMNITNMRYDTSFYQQSNDCNNPVQPGQSCPITLSLDLDLLQYTGPASVSSLFDVDVQAPGPGPVTVSATVDWELLD